MIIQVDRHTRSAKDPKPDCYDFIAGNNTCQDRQEFWDQTYSNGQANFSGKVFNFLFSQKKKNKNNRYDEYLNFK